MKELTLQLTDQELEDLGRCIFAGYQEDQVESESLRDKVYAALKELRNEREES